MGGAVAHFYFNLIAKTGEVMAPDEQGADFCDLHTAIADAESGFRELLIEALDEGRPVDFSAINILDQQGRLLLTLRFDERGRRIRPS
jgi:hypothetical protein